MTYMCMVCLTDGNIHTQDSNLVSAILLHFYTYIHIPFYAVPFGKYTYNWFYPSILNIILLYSGYIVGYGMYSVPFCLCSYMRVL